MDPDKITLDNLSKGFEYFKLSKEIDSLDNVESIKNVAKAYCKLYLKQQEVLQDLSSLSQPFIEL